MFIKDTQWMFKYCLRAIYYRKAIDIVSFKSITDSKCCSVMEYAFSEKVESLLGITGHLSMKTNLSMIQNTLKFG